jgi:hypothetical protein
MVESFEPGAGATAIACGIECTGYPSGCGIVDPCNPPIRRTGRCFP